MTEAEISGQDILTIYKKGKLVKTINLTPVKEITNNLENILMHRKNWKDRSHVEYGLKIIEEVKKLNKDQLEYVVTNLLGIITKYTDLYQTILDNPKKEGEKMQEYKNFLKKVKETIKKFQ